MSHDPRLNPPDLKLGDVRIDGNRVLIEYPGGTYAAKCHDEHHATELAQDIRRYLTAMNVPATYSGIELLLSEID